MEPSSFMENVTPTGSSDKVAGSSLATELAVDRTIVASLANCISTGDGAARSLEGLEATTGSALETVAAMRRGRPASPRLFGIGSGPLAIKGGSGTQSRSGSTPGTTRALGTGSVASKAVQDSAILTAVRRQMEALEDKLSGQIGRVQQQNDRLRDAALSRVDSKMVTMEALQPKLDRRIAELSGNYKGLSDEMQAQIRRLDQMDSRLWEWRHQLEEEVRSKFVEIEQNHQRVSSSIRVMTAANDDLAKRQNSRVQRIEGVLEDRQQITEDTNNGLMNIYQRLEQMEELRVQDLAIVSCEATSSRAVAEPCLSLGDSASIMAVETRLSDACAKIETLIEESRDSHTRVEAQEERLKSLHTRVESREEHYRWLNDRVERTDWEGRFKEIQAHLQMIDEGRIKHAEDIELISKKLESSDQATEECADQIRRMYVERQLFAVEAPRDTSADLQVDTINEALSLDVKDCTGRIGSLEERSDKLSLEVQSMRADVALAPRVGALVEQLKDVAPKVIEQEMCVRELLEKVGRLEVEDKMKSTMEQGKSESSAARMLRLEADVERLVVTVDTMETREADLSWMWPIVAAAAPVAVGILTALAGY